MKTTETLRRNGDFVRLYNRGKSQVHPLLVTYCRPNPRGGRRMGITATKKVGGAVQRNRAKRVIREAYRLLEDRVPPGWDFVFVARGRTPFVKMQQVHRVMESHLKALTAPNPSPKAPASGTQPRGSRKSSAPPCKAKPPGGA